MRQAELIAIDRRIGARIRSRRKDYGISMVSLAAAIGVSQQQVSKYERGATPIAASRLLVIAHELQMPVEWFLPAKRREFDLTL